MTLQNWGISIIIPKVKYDELYAQLQEKELDSYIVEGKLKDLTNEMSETENDKQKYRKMCDNLNEHIEELKRRCDGLSQIASLAEDPKVIKNLVEEKSIQLIKDSKLNFSPRVNSDEHISGPMAIEKQSEPLVNLNEDNQNAVSLFKMECTNRFESKEREVGLSKRDSKQPAGISENENHKEVGPTHTCDVGGKQRLDVSTGNTTKRLSNSTKCLTPLKTPLFGQEGEEYAIKCEAKEALVTEFVDEDDKSLVSKLRSYISTMNLCAGDVSVTFKGQNAKEYTTNSQQRLVSQRMCVEKKSQADGTSKDENTSPDNLEMDESSEEKVCSLTTESEKVADETDSDSRDRKSEAAMSNELDSNDEKDSK
ncbi:hypothetical protein MKX01_022523 [Papaver californicum]|nr:hypothetical protein MKX01_022523 [Papaver californicum]